MFSNTVTARHQTALEEQFNLKLHRYTVQEARARANTLTRLMDEGGVLRRPLTPEETSFILNEQLLCSIDFLYWAQRYAYIVDWFGEKRLFSPSVGQRIYLDVLSDLEDKDVALTIQALKARQLGITTVSELIIAHRVQFYPVDAVVASSDPSKSAMMAKKMDFVWENMPWYLMPCRVPWKMGKDSKKIKYRKGELIEFTDLDSAVSIQWGNQTTGISRGSTPKLAHLSEVAEYEKPEELIDASLIKAIHENPRTFLCLESTAMGKDNYWWKTWEFNKQNWPGAARLFPLFLPWFVGTDIYPSPAFLRKNPVPENWKVPDYILAHAKKCEKFVQNYPLLLKYLGPDWKLPIEQQWWYELNRREHVEKGTLADWFKEMPADDQEAFQVSGTSVLPAELISEYRDNCKPPLGAFVIEGPDVPKQLQPSRLRVEYRKDKPFIPLPGNYSLLPIKTLNYPMLDFDGKVFLYALPEDNEEYAVGVDTGEGVGGDGTSVQVIRKGSPDRNAEQVAEFTSAKVNAFEVWPVVWALCNLYSTKVNGEYQQAKLCVETASNGESLNVEMYKRGWRKFHLRHTPSRLGLGMQLSRLWGWKTNSLTRPVLMDFLITALKEGWLTINSPEFVRELDDLWVNEKRQNRIEHRPGRHDDRVFALAIPLYSLHWNSIYRSPSPAYTERVSMERERSEYPVYSPGLSELDKKGPRDRHIRW